MRTTASIRYIRYRHRYHLTAVAAMFLEAFGPGGYGEDWSLETSRNYLVEHPGNETYSYVAKADGAVVGAILARPEVGDAGRKLHIELVIVDKRLRGNGIGTKLWKLAVGNAKRIGFIGLELSTSRNLQAYRWYRAMGFTDNGWIEMEKALV